MNEKYDRIIHRMASFTGGFTGIYAVLIRANFGSSQTLNLLHLVDNFLSGNFIEAFFFFIGALIYGGAIFAVTIIDKKTHADIKLLSMAVNILGFIILSFLPENIRLAFALYPIFMMMSVQWFAFSKIDGYVTSSIFSTNNLRQLSDSLASYLCEHNKKHLEKAKVFAGSLLFFHLGAVAGYFPCKFFGIRASLFGIIPCIVLIAVIIISSKQKIKEKSGQL